jgi:hypothetical protein
MALGYAAALPFFFGGFRFLLSGLAMPAIRPVATRV